MTLRFDKNMLLEVPENVAVSVVDETIRITCREATDEVEQQARILDQLLVPSFRARRRSTSLAK